jgi:CheY-like chemotaxis protein
VRQPRLADALIVAKRDLRRLYASGTAAFAAKGISEMAVILVVEDDVFIREIAESIIQDWGHQILSACDVPEALIHLKSSDHIDAVFTDVNLKTEILGGCDVARLGILLRPGLRVLYTTATRDPDAMHARFAVGTHFLSKPYSERQLEISIQNLLN